MSLFYQVSEKELVTLRDDVFQKRGMPALVQNGFVRSPFSTSWFGKNDTGGYTYEFCRIANGSRLDMVLVHINRRDRWVQLHLNVFRLYPEVTAVAQLEGEDGLQFHLPPNSATLWRLTAPRGLILAGSPKHKVGFYLTRLGLNHRLEHLGELLEQDLAAIDTFVHRWLEEHSPLVTNWKGIPITTTGDRPLPERSD